MTEAEFLVSTDPAAMLADAQLSARQLRLFACACARQVWHLLTDARSRLAVEVAERFADGEATKKELMDACGNALGFASGIDRYDVTGQTPASKERLTAWLAVWPANDPSMIAHNAHSYLRRNVADKAGAAELLRGVAGNPFRPVTLDPAHRTSLALRLAQAAYEERTAAGKETCKRCGGKGRERDADSFSGYGTATCQRCDGRRVVEMPGGTLDPDRLLILADALIDAGCPETVEAASPGWFRCGGCGKEYKPRHKYDDCGGNATCEGLAVSIATRRVPNPLLAALREPVARWRGFWAVDVVLGKS